jgi:hypothetical protein
MNAKSKFNSEEPEFKPRLQNLRGGCGVPYSMFSEATRIDMSHVHAPGFLKKIFQALGWKTENDERPDK